MIIKKFLLFLVPFSSVFAWCLFNCEEKEKKKIDKFISNAAAHPLSIYDEKSFKEDFKKVFEKDPLNEHVSSFLERQRKENKGDIDAFIENAATRNLSSYSTSDFTKEFSDAFHLSPTFKEINDFSKLQRKREEEQREMEKKLEEENIRRRREEAEREKLRMKDEEKKKLENQRIKEVDINEIVGLEKLKEKLNITKKYNGTANGFLAYGPPGCGKTYYLLAVANELSNVKSFFLSPGELAGSVDREGLVRFAFEQARKRPSILFFDEMDTLFSNKTEGSLSGLLKDLTEGQTSRNENVTFFGITNEPWNIEPALRSRFSDLYYFPPPPEKVRERYFGVYVKRQATTCTQKDIESFVSQTNNYSFRDLRKVMDKVAAQSTETMQAATHFCATEIQLEDRRGRRQTVMRYVPCGRGELGAEEIAGMDWAEWHDEMGVVTRPDTVRQAIREVRVQVKDFSKYELFTAEFGMNVYEL